MSSDDWDQLDREGNFAGRWVLSLQPPLAEVLVQASLLLMSSLQNFSFGSANLRIA